MKKLLYILIIGLFSCNFSADVGETIVPEKANNVRVVNQSALIRQIYMSQVGVRENPAGSNKGKEVEKYLASVGLKGGYAWCAAFYKWCLFEADVKGIDKINGMALSCVNKSNMVYSNGKFVKDPEAGDAVTFYYSNLKRIGHVGFFDAKTSETMYRSVEGNTNGAGSREGDGVYIKYRSFKSTYNISRWHK